MSIISENTKIKVSSTLDKSTPRKSLIDRDPGTCWTSTQGLPQWVQLSFPAEAKVHPKQLFITFQGGFVATRVAVYTTSDLTRDPEWTFCKHIFPDDVNRKQQFDLTTPNELNNTDEEQIGKQGDETEKPVAQIKLEFEQSSDFFGRVTIYDLDIHGVIASEG